MTDFSSKTVAFLRESGFEVYENRWKKSTSFHLIFHMNDKRILNLSYTHPDNQFCLLNIPRELFDVFEEEIESFKQIFLKDPNHFLFIFDSNTKRPIYKIFTHDNNKHMHSILEILKKDLYARHNKIIWKYDNDEYTVLCHMKKAMIQLHALLHNLKEFIHSPEEALSMYEQIKRSEIELLRIEKLFQKELEIQSQEKYIQQNLKSYRMRKQLKPPGTIQNFDFEFYLIGRFTKYRIRDLNQNNVDKIVTIFLENIKIMTTFLRIARRYDPFLFLMTNEFNSIMPGLFLFKREFGLYFKRKEEKGELQHVLLLTARESIKHRKPIKRTEICFSLDQFESLFEKHIKSLRAQSLFQDSQLQPQFLLWQKDRQEKKTILEANFYTWFEDQYKDFSEIPFLNKEKKLEFIDSLPTNSQ